MIIHDNVLEQFLLDILQQKLAYHKLTHLHQLQPHPPQTNLCLHNLNPLLHVWEKVICLENNPPLPLLFQFSVGFPLQGKGCLKHEGVDVVVALKFCLPVVPFFLRKIGINVCHLDVGVAWFKFISINLWKSKEEKKERERWLGPIYPCCIIRIEPDIIPNS